MPATAPAAVPRRDHATSLHRAERGPPDRASVKTTATITAPAGYFAAAARPDSRPARKAVAFGRIVTGAFSAPDPPRERHAEKDDREARREDDDTAGEDHGGGRHEVVEVGAGRQVCGQRPRMHEAVERTRGVRGGRAKVGRE